MEFVKFEIKNFKGINNLIFDFEGIPTGKIFPLVGLNESGKTTILEAINLFQNRIKEGGEHQLIHKKEKGNFNDNIEIKAVLKLDDYDKEFIKNFLNNKKLELEEENDYISIIRKYEFKDSNFEKYQPFYEIKLNVKTRQAKKFVRLYDKYFQYWSELIKEIEENLIPKILYFENFLFDFPEKIYLEGSQNSGATEEKKQKEFRKIIQDILDSIENKNYNLNRHILEKLKNPTEENNGAVKQVINDMCEKLNDTIIKYWKEIFKGSTKKV
jgi:predicted ATP-dependent endonuclease of OLD family